MEIVSTQIKTYKPEFDTEKDIYYDNPPFKKYERGIPHKCPCKTGKLFNNLTQYNQHINTKTHQNYILNYKNHNQELDSLKEEIKELTAKNEFLIRKNIDFQKEIDELKSKIYELENEEVFLECQS